MRLICIACLFLSMNLFGQSNLTYTSVDSISYVQFIQNNYTGLKTIVKNAEKQGIDFLYMHTRFGIVAFNQGKFVESTPQFEAAYAMSPNDTIIQEYLYYSYLYNDQAEQARALVLTFNESLQKKVGFSNHSLDQFVLSIGPSFSNNYSKNGASIYLGPGISNVETLNNRNFFREGIYTKHTLGQRFQLYNSLSMFQLKSTGIIQFPGMKTPETKDYSSNYFQYNIGLGYQSKNNWLFSGGFGAYRSTLNWYTYHLNPSSMRVLTTETTNYTNFSGSLTVGKRLKYFYPTASFHVSSFLNSTQTQEELNLTVYPLGNNNLFTTASFSNINDTESHQVYGLRAGGMLGKSVLLDGEVAFGNLANRITSNGFSTYNSMDKITLNTGVNIHVFSKKRLEYVFSYYFQQKTGQAYQYTSTTAYNLKDYTYNVNNLIFTLKWNF